MLQAINDKAKGIIGWVIIGLISITFALFGIADYADTGSAAFAAKVDDTEISIRSYQEALSRQRQQLESMYGGKLPNDSVFETHMKKQVLDQLISRAVISNRVAEAGYRINDQMAAAEIKKIESFQEKGAFSSALYKKTLGFQGMSIAEFESLMRSDMVIMQLQNGVMNSSIVGEKNLKQLSQLQQQTRDVSYVEFNNTNYIADVTLTDDEVKQYYNDNSSRYMHPEKVSISYVEIKTDEIKSNVEIDEVSIRNQYDDYVASLASNEQRHAKHILIQLDADADAAKENEAKNKINDALVKLKAGESFDKIAKNVSEDLGSASKGGDLGWVNKGIMGDMFDDVLFGLKKDKISDVIKTSFGYHIIKLVDIKATTPDSYEVKKGELVKDLQQQDVEKTFYERSELMATLAYENDDSLLPVTDALDLNVIESELFTRGSGAGLLSNKAVRDAAFSSSVLQQGRNSDVIEISSNHIIVLRINQHIEASPQNIEEVKPAIEMVLKSIKAKEKAQAESLQVLAELQKGKSLKDVIEDKNAIKVLGEIKRDHAKTDRSIVAEAFQMNKPDAERSSYKIAELRNGVAIIALNAINKSDTRPAEKDMQEISKMIETDLSNQEMAAVIGFIKSQAEIIESKSL